MEPGSDPCIETENHTENSIEKRRVDLPLAREPRVPETNDLPSHPDRPEKQKIKMKCLRYREAAGRDAFVQREHSITALVVRDRILDPPKRWECGHGYECVAAGFEHPANLAERQIV